ncbi:MAG TPA: hypothetical protein VM534_10145 [Thermoanaerobaculia bacterium]|nr:hypothetical protein [Thermoanaerobaculia bacterium]
MATRTVRLDAEAERTLREVQEATGLPISEVLKRGLEALRDEVREEATRTPWEVYRDLDPGAGGYSRATAADAKRAVRAALRRKLGR